MPPKVGLLGSLSAAALIAALTVSGPAKGQEDQEQLLRGVCEWVEEQDDPAELATIIAALENNDEECIFDPETGQNYCTVCLTVAANKLADLVQPAAGPDTPSA